jgi:hypothetical protein
VEGQLPHLTNPRENRFCSAGPLFHRYHSRARGLDPTNKENSEEADKRYKDQFLEVDGAIALIDKPGLRTLKPFPVTLVGDEPGRGVVCYFWDITGLDGLNNASKFTLRGFGDGFRDNKRAWLRNCVFLKKE